MSEASLEGDQSRAKWVNLLLGHDPKQQRYVVRTGLAVVTYGIVGTVGEIAVADGLVETFPVRMFEALAVLASLLSYALVRSGWSKRFHDPGLTLWQMGFGSLLATWCYPYFDQVRGSLIALQLGIVMFGTFNLSRYHLWRFSVFVVLCMGSIMWWSNHQYPARYPASIEWVYFVMFVGLQPIAVVLGNQFGAMRTSLKRHRAELQDALQTIRELASRDELTGLYNRRQAVSVMEQWIRNAEQHAAVCSLAMIDLDLFKQINDDHGHHVGDEALKAFTAEAQETLRGSELIARWGGEEFLVLLPRTDTEGARHAMARLRERLKFHQISAETPALRVCFSSGVTDLRAGDQLESVLQRADQALYQAKRQGRGRDVVHVENMST
ncbi:MAG: GGDEF domain-containing protein [Burkholderiales bacterium]|nr:GGDEF domain-containing protein [Burkholderiales bacterium]